MENEKQHQIRALERLGRTRYTPSHEIFWQLLTTTFWMHAAANSYIVRTVGIQAVFDILQKIAGEAIAARTLSESYFVARLNGAKDVDFSHNFFQASGIGRGRIRHAIALAAGLETLDAIPPADREQFAAITGNH